MVWVLQPSLKVGGTHGGMEVAEPCGQRARRLGVCPSGVPPVQKMVALGQGPRAAAGEGLQTLWLCAAHLLGPRLWITAQMRGG